MARRFVLGIRELRNLGAAILGGAHEGLVKL